MMIEFIGSTGAGKSTLIQQIRTAGERNGLQVVVGHDFVLQQSRLAGIRNRLVQAILINIIAITVGLTTCYKHWAFYRFALRTILQLPGAISWLEKLYLAKNILKRMGADELMRRQNDGQQVYLIDEGALHIAHNLFVQVAGEVNHSAIATFAQLAPLPQVVVYVQQDQAVLIERTLRRGHHRVPDRSAAAVEHFVQQAVQVFDELVQQPTVASRLLMVDNAQQRLITVDDDDDPWLAQGARLVQAGLQTAAIHHPIADRQPVH